MIDLLVAAVKMFFGKVVLFLTLEKAKNGIENNSPAHK